MSDIEQRYIAELQSWSGTRKLERVASLYESTKDMLALQIMKEWPSISESELRLKIAERLYASDKEIHHLLSRAH
ncbi:MAG: hypothetical protein EA369_00020 [Bradymonadales bacterium]|nr:MAG: hypothetical protein EA369_00020 [Bradymonadales bacterium]